MARRSINSVGSKITCVVPAKPRRRHTLSAASLLYTRQTVYKEPLPGVLMSAAAAISAKRRRIVRAFRDGAARSPESARPLGELGVSRSLVFQMLIRSGVVVATAEDRFYLDEAAEALDRQKRRIRVILLVAIGLVRIATLLLIL